MSTIIVCIDNNSASENALNYACMLAKKNKFNIQILAVIDGSHRNLLFASGAISSQQYLQIQRHINKLIDDICLPNNIKPNISIREGEIINEITKEVKIVEDCRLLVFGKAQNSQSDNTVLPKIVGKIGNKINTPVIIIPQNFSLNSMIEDL